MTPPHSTATRPPAPATPHRLHALAPRAGPRGFAKLLPKTSPSMPPVPRKVEASRAAPDREDPAPAAAKKNAAPEEASDRAFDPLDPAARRAAQLAPPPGTPAPLEAPALVPGAPAEAMAPRARVSMEELLPQLVRRIAWAGDRTRGSVQLELGAGRHAGTTVTVHADHGRVRVELAGVGADELRDRIDARLKARGLDVESVR